MEVKGALRIPVNLDLRNCNFMAANSPEMLVNFTGNAEGTPHEMSCESRREKILEGTAKP